MEPRVCAGSGARKLNIRSTNSINIFRHKVLNEDIAAYNLFTKFAQLDTLPKRGENKAHSYAKFQMMSRKNSSSEGSETNEQRKWQHNKVVQKNSSGALALRGPNNKRARQKVYERQTDFTRSLLWKDETVYKEEPTSDERTWR